MKRRDFLKTGFLSGLFLTSKKPPRDDKVPNDLEEVLGEKPISIKEAPATTCGIFVLGDGGTIFRSDDFRRYDRPNWTVVGKAPKRRLVWKGRIPTWQKLPKPVSLVIENYDLKIKYEDGTVVKI